MFLYRFMELEAKEKKTHGWLYFNYTSFLERMPLFDKAKMHYQIHQKERCPETQKLHWQGFVKFKTQTSFRRAQVLLGDPTCHIEPARNNSASIAYCSKNDTRVEGPFEFGDRSQVMGQGHRSDLDVVKTKLDLGMSPMDISKEHFPSWVRYHRSFELYSTLKVRPRDFKSFVIVLTGPTGVGKTKWFWDNFPGGYALSRGTNSNIWWDGYNNNFAVILDDYYGWLPWDTLLRLLDRYPFRIEYKGGSREFVSRVICITSNVSYENWYPSVGPDKLPALLRRIDYNRDSCTQQLFGSLTGDIIGCPKPPGNGTVGPRTNLARELPQPSRLTTIATKEQESIDLTGSDSESESEINIDQ